MDRLFSYWLGVGFFLPGHWVEGCTQTACLEGVKTQNMKISPSPHNTPTLGGS